MVLADVHCMDSNIRAYIDISIHIWHGDYSRYMIYSNITLTSHSIIINKEKEGVAANDKKNSNGAQRAFFNASYFF